MLAKRTLDIVVSGTLMVLTLPIMVLIALIVKLDSAGPAVFTQARVGANRRRVRALNGGGLNPARERRKKDLGGASFTMFKFRSMVQEAEAMLPSLVNLGGLSEPVYKLDDDPRVTRFGRLLRQSSLDELPQLFNVLKGNMSLVGPRPEALRVVALYGENHRTRLQVKPGLTGLQQVSCRGTKSMQARLKYDLHYIKHRSLWLDLLILFKTFFVVIRGNGAH
jgi:lipopolysaccharide/colanic/teichoic acid biosynthesis glycosyltransferase